MFRYEEYYAENRFSLFIKKIWILDNLANPMNITNKSVFPNGCFNIAIIEGEGLIIKHLGMEKHLISGCYFCGQMTQVVSVHILPKSKATMIQLHPWAPAHFTQADMSKFTDEITSFDKLEIASKQMEKLSGKGPLEIYQAVVMNFYPLLITGPVPELIYKAASIIMNTGGKQSVSKLATDLGCSTRHMQKIFKRHIGLSPKQLSLIVRLRGAVDEIAYPQKDTLSITDLALDNNFYDQAHFINAFKTFARMSPRKINIPDYFLSFKK